MVRSSREMEIYKRGIPCLTGGLILNRVLLLAGSCRNVAEDKGETNLHPHSSEFLFPRKFSFQSLANHVP